MTVSCSFCQTLKAQQYIFAECQHLICINCAALRATETIKCCNIQTQLSQSVKMQLKQKKQIILNNLSSGYAYDKCNIANQDNDQLSKDYDQDYDFENQFHPRKQRSQLKQEDSCLPETESINNEKKYDFEASPIDQIYPVFKGSQRKLNSNPSEVLIEDSNFKRVQNPRQEIVIVQQQFKTVLNEKLSIIKQQFKNIYEDLANREKTVIEESRCYYEQFMRNLVKNKKEKQFCNIRLEYQNLSLGLEKINKKWCSKAIGSLVKSVPNLTNDNKSTFNQPNIQKSIYSSKRQQQGYNSPHQRLKEQPQLITKSKANSIIKQNIVPQKEPECQGIDKIYKKLEQSKHKLEQRINRHNNFISQRVSSVKKL